jgi:hypothetical protein
MKLLPAVIALAIAFGVAYGVLFSRMYPQVTIFVGLISLFGLLGLLTAMAVIGIWQWIFASKKHDSQES